MGENHGNIFKMLKNKFKPQTADSNQVREEDKEEDQARRDLIKILNGYNNEIAAVYSALLRLLNAHPDYDSAVRDTSNDVYYAENDSPGEKILIQAKALRELMWDTNLAGCVVRFGLEISEVEKVFQRDGHQQLFHIRKFFCEEYVMVERMLKESRALLLKTSNSDMSQRKKDKALKESDRLYQCAKNYIMNELPKARETQLAGAVYLMRCYRQYHLSLRVRFAGMSIVKVPRPAVH